MRIGFLGTRGIPACYSGFETFLEQLSVRLVQRGHSVTVYNRIPFNRHAENTFKGVRIVRLPTIPTKSTDTIVHTFLSVLHALGQDFDIVYFCGVGNSLWSFVPRLRKAKTIVNVDGADFARAKWSGFGRWWLHRSESWAARLADVVVADNGTIKQRYRELYGVDAELIPYGSNVVTQDPGGDALKKFQLTPKNYFLYVSRLTPENAADLAMTAHQASGAGLPLVVIGDAPYQHEYIARLKAITASAKNIVMTGYLFGAAYQQLSFHARAFILPTAIDATRPVLLDQMGFGNCVIVRDTPGNLEVVGDTAITFSHADPERSLAAALQKVAADAPLAARQGQMAQQRVRDHYDWDVICSRYEALFQKMVEGVKPRGGHAPLPS
jgi:glycosyltransferase involved in cell wall biosynthesis